MNTIALPKGGLLIYGKQLSPLIMTAQENVITLGERLAKVVLDPILLVAGTPEDLEKKVQAWVEEKEALIRAHGPLPGELWQYVRSKSLPGYCSAEVVLVAHEAELKLQEGGR